MLTKNVSTLKIHKLTQEQYDRELAAGNIDDNALYLTPDDTNDRFSNPNLLINGDFQVWQRGESFSEIPSYTITYTADRWAVYTTKDTSPTITKVSDGLHLKYSLATVVTLFQPLEESLLNKLKGKTVTFTYAKTDYNGNYNEYSKQVSVPSSLTPVDFERIYFGISLYNEDTLHWVKLEQGSIATSFVPRLYAEEFAMCQRYYQHHRNIWARRISTNVAKYRLMYVMRVEPTLSGTFTLWTLENSQKETLSSSALYAQINCIDIFKNNASYEWHVRCEDAYLDAEIY